METKFLSLRHPVELGSRFGDWQVCCWADGLNDPVERASGSRFTSGLELSETA